MEENSTTTIEAALTNNNDLIVFNNRTNDAMEIEYAPKDFET